MSKVIKNKRVRKALIDAGLKQKDLAKLLYVSEGTVSILLRLELAKEEQERIISLINNHN